MCVGEEQADIENERENKRERKREREAEKGRAT